MSRKRHKPEEIVAKLRQVEVVTAQGRTAAEANRSIGVTRSNPGRFGGSGQGRAQLSKSASRRSCRSPSCSRPGRLRRIQGTAPPRTVRRESLRRTKI